MAGPLVVVSGMELTFVSPGPWLSHGVPTPWQLNEHPGALAQEDLLPGGRPRPSTAEALSVSAECCLFPSPGGTGGTEHPTALGLTDQSRKGLRSGPASRPFPRSVWLL